MCLDPVSLAVIGGAAALGGAGLSYASGQSAASDAASAQTQEESAQEQAFAQRQSAATTQLQQQTAADTTQEQQFQQNQAATQSAEEQAMTDRQTALTGINNQEQAIADKANQVVSTGTQAASAPALAGAQTSQLAEQQGLNNTAAQDTYALTPSDPNANPNGGDSTVSNDAFDQALASSQAKSGQYGTTLADLGSYQAPIELADQTATNIGTNLMPAAAADQLLKSSAPALLAPSSTAYTQAGVYGQAANEDSALEQQGALGVAALQDTNAGALADQNQQDTDTRIQNTLSTQQQRAAQLKGLGDSITSLGSAGLGIAGSQGAFSGLSSILGGGAAAPQATLVGATPTHITANF